MMHDANVPADVEADGPSSRKRRRADCRRQSYPMCGKNHFVRPEDQDAVGVQIGGRYDGSPVILFADERASGRHLPGPLTTNTCQVACLAEAGAAPQHQPRMRTLD